MRGGSFQSYDEAFASEGVVAGDAIDPDRGSVNPFLPRQRCHEGHARYKVDSHRAGIPTTGREQTRYWSWCAGQFVSPVNVTQAYLMDNRGRTAKYPPFT